MQNLQRIPGRRGAVLQQRAYVPGHCRRVGRVNLVRAVVTLLILGELLGIVREPVSVVVLQVDDSAAEDGCLRWALERSWLAAVTVSGGDLILVVRSREGSRTLEQVQARETA